MLIFAVLLFISIGVFRRRLHETSTRLHSSLAVIGLVTTWLHLKQRVRPSFGFSVICLLLASTVMAIALIMQALRIILCNIPRPLPSAKVSQCTGSSILKIKVEHSRMWKISPGQYFYLMMPAVAFFFFGEPFPVVWSYDPNGRIERGLRKLNESQKKDNIGNESIACDDDSNSEQAEGSETECDEQNEDVSETDRGNEENNGNGTMWFLVKPRASGTRALADFNPTHDLLTLVEGPYGCSLNLMRYAHIVAFSKGMGMAALLLYLRTLLYDTILGYSLTRRITVLWELDSESKVSYSFE